MDEHDAEWHNLARYCEDGGLEVEGDETRGDLLEAIWYLVEAGTLKAAA